MHFSYPPHALILLAIFGCLSLFRRAGPVVAGRRSRASSPSPSDACRSGTTGMLLWALLLAPVVWINIDATARSGCCWPRCSSARCGLLPARPILAGVLIGVMTIKPQLGLLLAPMLLLLAARGARWQRRRQLPLCSSRSASPPSGVEPWHVYIADNGAVPLALRRDHGRVLPVPDDDALYGCCGSWGCRSRPRWRCRAVISVVVALAACVVIRSAAGWPLKASGRGLRARC